MIQMNIKENVTQRALSLKEHKKISNKTLNNLAELCRNRTQSYILGDYNYDRADVSVKLERAIGNSNKALLIATRKAKNLLKFGAIQTNRGIKAFVKKGKATSRSSAFIGTAKGTFYKRQKKHGVSGPQMVFQHKKGFAYRLKGLRAASIGELLKSKYNMRQLNALMKQRGDAIYNGELQKVL
jgi:hypothetical protein